MDAGLAAMAPRAPPGAPGNPNNKKWQMRNQLLQNDIGNIDINYEHRLPMNNIQHQRPHGNMNMNMNANIMNQRMPNQHYGGPQQQFRKPNYKSNVPYMHMNGNSSMPQMGGVPRPNYPGSSYSNNSRTSSFNQRSISNLLKVKSPNIPFGKSLNNFGKKNHSDGAIDDDEGVEINGNTFNPYSFNDVTSISHKNNKFNHSTDSTPIIPTIGIDGSSNTNSSAYRKYKTTQKKMAINTMARQNQANHPNDQRSMSLQNYPNQTRNGNIQHAPMRHPMRPIGPGYYDQNRANSLTDIKPSNTNQNFAYNNNLLYSNQKPFPNNSNPQHVYNSESQHFQPQDKQNIRADTPPYRNQIPKIEISTDESSAISSTSNLITDNLNSSVSEFSNISSSSPVVKPNLSSHEFDSNISHSSSPLKNQVSNHNTEESSALQLMKSELETLKKKIEKKEETLKQKEDNLLVREKQLIKREQEITEKENYIMESLEKRSSSTKASSEPLLSKNDNDLNFEKESRITKDSISTYISSNRDSPQIHEQRTVTGLYKLENSTDIGKYMTAQEFQRNEVDDLTFSDINNHKNISQGTLNLEHSKLTLTHDSVNESVSVSNSNHEMLEDTFQYKKIKQPTLTSNIYKMKKDESNLKSKFSASKDRFSFEVSQSAIFVEGETGQRGTTNIAANTSNSPELVDSRLDILNQNKELTSELFIVSKELADSIQREISLENRLDSQGISSPTMSGFVSIQDYETELRTKSERIVSLIEELNNERKKRYEIEEQIIINGLNTPNFQD
ncbi:hypothetical protein Kpol_339p3 [Vanderwaltozyma polyspora DSM 70294]|uniref:Uncharacterized protein n=1 Tax=Vanderwaltozyma polyspora (strain ATCC 22028 / DSM 70294 / BCRC 21397 / CBS 2163 / NBRC 10782 / NRRL Y-8283 / UCD 57-17) TaxID=436907 RepID=A7TSD1_VANPO|nr:uncharacterized protein Kpol_339p3 [Vanderwaltozyma polyspora DSM 70294]EDO14816.1 hypothetical protein Kpol_339p3 [Vanderwaltozyma polyspora DSM 70294]